MKKKIIFLSGANISTGGPLEIYRDILKILNNNYINCKVFAIISDKNLFVGYENIEYIEIKNYKKFIFNKFYFEYFKYYYISIKYDIDMWFSLNDCTPSVKAKKRVVYCHNATPFYKRSLKDYLNPTRVFLQSFYYILFYKINLKKNNFIIVQQKWMKEYFYNVFDFEKSKILVNRIQNDKSFIDTAKSNIIFNSYTFIYPTKPETYKNIQIILEACTFLIKRGVTNFKIILTISKNDNRYSQYLFSKYNSLEVIDWTGYLSKLELNKLYNMSNCLIFSSKLETWGLPISEFKCYNKPLLLANLPYAHETAGDYGFCKFFDPDKPAELSFLMENLINGNKFDFDKTNKLENDSCSTSGFNELLDFLFNNT
jgi:hypothetical protein